MVVIVGAGPAGLALSYWLTRTGVAHRVLERAEVGYSWTQHYDALKLHTLRQVSGLPGLPMPHNYPQFPSAAQFTAYLRQYAAHFQLPIETGVQVEAAHPDRTRWMLRTNRGERHADVLVAASGIWAAPLVPSIPGLGRFGGSVTHSAAYRSPAAYQGQRVLVVGVGNSGAEIAAELGRAGVSVDIAVRSGAVFAAHQERPERARRVAWLLRHMPRPLGWLLRRRNYGFLKLPLPPGNPLDHYPVVGYALPEAVAAGQVVVRSALTRLEPGLAVFADGGVGQYDALIMATGYGAALDWLSGEVALDTHGRPVVDADSLARRDPPLFCVGYRYPATEGWLQAIGRVTERAARAVASTDRDRM